jgi:hypothetical protein
VGDDRIPVAPRGAEAAARVTARAAFTAGVLGALLGCDGRGSDLPREVRWSSEHFDYWTRASETGACADVLTPLERHFATLESYLGFAWPAGKRVAYDKFVDGKDLDAHGGCEGAPGCTYGSEIEVTGALDTHELVHAYLSETGTPPPVLIEGVAVALSCSAAYYAVPKPTIGWEALASLSEGPADVYPPGAWLVAYLLDAYGPGPFLNVYATLPYHASAADMDAAFRAGYGKSLADIWAAALAEDQPRNTCIWECSGPPLALDGQPFDTAGVCGVDTKRPFALAEEATVAFTANGGTGLGLGPCGPVTPPAVVVFAIPTVVTIFHLPAGRYFLENGYTPGTIVGTADASATLNPDCAAATDSSLLDVANIFVAVPPGDAPWFLALPPPTKPTLAVLEAGGDGAAALCTSCATGAACTDLRSEAVDVAAGDTLRLTPDPKHPWSGFEAVFE